MIVSFESVKCTYAIKYLYIYMIFPAFQLSVCNFSFLQNLIKPFSTFMSFLHSFVKNWIFKNH